VLRLVELVGDGTHGTRGTAGERVIGSVTLGLLLVGLLGCLSRTALNGLRGLLAQLDNELLML